MNKTILLVEYDSTVNESITDLFSGDGLDLNKVEDGEAAKKILEKKKFDLVITAAMLPKFHGFYLSQHIKESYPTTSVIIISGVFKGYEYRQQALTQYLADDYFEKPLDLVKLKKKAFELMKIKEDSSEFDPSVTQIPKAKTNKIPTLKSLEQEQNRLTSDDIFGDILKKIESSNSGVKIDLEQPKTKPEPTPRPKPPEPKPTVTDRSEMLKELVVIEEPAQVSPSVLLKKPLNLDSIIPDKSSQGEPKKEYRKLEDEISKKFEETLSGLGLSSKPATPKASSPQPQKLQVPLVTPIVPPKVQKTETGEEVGGYEILGPIARGGMAEIYKAKKKGVKGFEKIIALKKILSGYGEDQKYIEMFVDEAKIAAQLAHPNIVQIYDLGRKDDYYFIAMEYVEGKDLRLLLRQMAENDKYLPVELSIYMIIKVLEALYYAHTAKDNRGQTLDIVHRDVSPPNILIGYNGEVKLTDFGVSKASIKMHQTISGALKGKLLYMSPEQAKGDRNIDCRSDIFSAGVIFFEMLTNTKLFLDESEIQVLKKVQEGDITLPSAVRKEIDSELEEILLKSLKKDPKVRYQNAIEMAEALNTYLQKHYTQSPSPAHIAHFLMTQFAEDIRKNNIKIDLKKEPYQISLRTLPSVEKSAEPVKPTKTELEKKPSFPPQSGKVSPATTTFATQKIPVTPARVMEKAPTIRSDEEFIAMEDQPIEIDLSSDNKEKAPVELPTPQPTPSPYKKPEHVSIPPKPIKEAKATSYHEELALLEKESGSKKKLLFIAAAIIVVAISLYIFFSPGKATSSVTDQTALVTTTPSQTDPSATDTEANIEEPISSAGTNDAQNMTIEGTPPKVETTQQPGAQQTASTKAEVKPITPTESKPVQVQKQPLTTPQTQEKKPEQIKPLVLKQEPTPEPIKPKPIPTASTEKKDPPQPLLQADTQTAVVEKKPEEQKPEETTPTQQPTPPKQTIPVAPEPVKQIVEGMELPINEVDIPPQKTSAPEPEISKKILKTIPANTTVLARILVSHTGQIEKVVMSKRSGNYDADMAIIGTLGNWTYKPARKNNIAVKVWLTIPITLNQ